jgi:stearoyl-CoA desaturase (delta-9 desaturase)
MLSKSDSGKREINWVSAIYLILVPIGAVTLVPMAIMDGYLTKSILIYTVIHYFVDTFSITTGYHRLVSHKSFEVKPWLKALFMVTGASAVQNSALLWATDHRRHHSFEDTDKDPYNIKKGFWWAHIGWMLFKDKSDYYNHVPKDLQEDRIIQWQHRNYLPLAMFMCFGVPTLAGWAMGNAWGGFVFGGVLRIFVSSHCTFLINSACHYFGKTTYSRDLTARDNWFIALFTCGEGFHNFHHKFQADYRNGIKWFHWDPTKWGVEIFAKLGWATNLRRISDEKILQARLQVEQERLKEQGANVERLSFLQNCILQVQEEQKLLAKKLEELRDSSEPLYRELQEKFHEAGQRFKKNMNEWKLERKLCLARAVA